MQFSIITAEKPDRLSKAFAEVQGRVHKVSGGNLEKGIVEKISCANLAELAQRLQVLTPAQAVTWGVCEYDSARIITKYALEREKGEKESNGKPIVARDRKNFNWPKGPAIFMLDYDPPKNANSLHPFEILQILYTTCPKLKNSPHLVRASASSHIFLNGVPKIGARGWRILFYVADGRDIPRAGEALFKRLWLAGHGHIEISKSGAKLVRAIVDNSVWQPERLDFCAGAFCKPPVEQRMPDPDFFSVDAPPLDTLEAIPDLTLEDESALKEQIAKAKQATEPQAHTARQEWVNHRVTQEMQKPENQELAQHDFKKKEEKVRQKITAAVHEGILLGDFVLLQEDGTEVTVGKLLDDPQKYHNRRFADPIENSYKNDRRIAKVNLRAAGRPYIWSFAHGGRRYQLHRAPATINIIAGQRSEIVNRCMELACIEGTLYQRGGELVRANEKGEIITLDVERALMYLDRLARWKKFAKTSGEWIATDAPRPVAAGLIASKGEWKLPTLSSITTAPTMDLPSGRVIDTDGHDKKTGILLILDNFAAWQRIPDKPTEAQVGEAIKILWAPFEKFPFDSAVARGVHLAALLTAPVRRVLPTAPATLYTAPTAASGKTLLARCVGILAGEDCPAMIPVVTSADASEEIRKRLLSFGRQGSGAMILDNITGSFDSDALCAWLTTEQYTDRILGSTEMLRVPTQSMVILTGNNVTLKGDICRRVLSCRIDAKMETPWKRAFEVDPAEYCRANRLKMTAAALSVVRFALQNFERPPDRTASFETWSDAIRRAICCVEALDLLPKTRFTDPVQSIDSSYDYDPETQKLHSLLVETHEVNGENRWRVADLIKKGVQDQLASESMMVPNNEAGNLANALEEICGQRGQFNSRILGRWIEKNSGRIINDLCFERDTSVVRPAWWRVKKVKPL